jgi:flagellar assembly factor FliW
MNATAKKIVMLNKPSLPLSLENRFGTFLVQEEDYLHFHEGLVGFSDYTHFALLPLPNAPAGSPFRLLQSLDDANLTFIIHTATLATTLLKERDALAVAVAFGIHPEQLVISHIATLRSEANAPKLTLNLRAPVFVDVASKTGFQHVLANPEYDLQYVHKQG